MLVKNKDYYFDNIFSFEGARPEKGLRMWPFSKVSKTKIFRNELQLPSLPYFDAQHSICEIFTFFLFGCRGVPKI